jgi:hypothetical protein
VETFSGISSDATKEVENGEWKELRYNSRSKASELLSPLLSLIALEEEAPPLPQTEEKNNQKSSTATAANADAFQTAAIVACSQTVWPQSGALSCDLLTCRICTPAATNSHGLYFFFRHCPFFK